MNCLLSIMNSLTNSVPLNANDTAGPAAATKCLPDDASRPVSRAHHLFVDCLQPAKLVHPLLQGQAADLRHRDRAVDPIVSLAGTEQEIAAAFDQTFSVTEPHQFIIHCLQCEPRSHESLTIIIHPAHHVRI